MKTPGFQFDTTYTQLPQRFFTHGSPDVVKSPAVIKVNHELASLMGLDFSGLSAQRQAELFSLQALPEGATPFSQAYAGHQFGYFSLLGDGRAHIWGEHIGPEGQRWDIQSKGSGRTPYSRRGDGKAVLGPMLREYLISEAMHHLGIPTTRSLAVVTSGDLVMREAALPGAILTRVASSHIRVGTFEYAADQLDKASLQALMVYTVNRHYPSLAASQQSALGLLEVVMEKQIELITHWMRVGFIHGVMNTDNMTISGETIDYGPCAFMDVYHPSTVFSAIDDGGRYAYDQQPRIAAWNLARFAEALLPLIDDRIDVAIDQATVVVSTFQQRYQQAWLKMMCAKIGLMEVRSGDDQLVADILQWMQKNHADYTHTFYDLSQNNELTNPIYQHKSFQDWYQRWQLRLQQNTQPLTAAWALMRHTNPAVIPRNHQVEKVLQAAYAGDFDLFQALLAVLKRPYEDNEVLRPYQKPPTASEQVYQTFCGT